MCKFGLSPAIALCFLNAIYALPQNPSTAEERMRLVDIAHKMETNPLDPALRADREWAIKWLIQVPDIHVGMCPTVLGNYNKYKYAGEITAQLMLAEAEFAIENPEKAKDQPAQYLAGAEGALRAYNVILQHEPKAKSKALDDDIEKQKQGKLKESVEALASKSCQNRS